MGRRLLNNIQIIMKWIQSMVVCNEHILLYTIRESIEESIHRGAHFFSTIEAISGKEGKCILFLCDRYAVTIIVHNTTFI